MEDSSFKYDSNAAALLANLQPVRDLALNFDIDIAAHLGEYLEKLVDVLHGSQGVHGIDMEWMQYGTAHPGEGLGSTNSNSSSSFSSLTFDFAQAALLVQNSSAVYSRKVDYFSSLVHKTLESFQQQQRNRDSLVDSATKRRRSPRSGTVTDEDAAFWDLLRDETYEFLSLEKVLPIAKASDITCACRLSITSMNTLNRRRRNSSIIGGPLSVTSASGLYSAENRSSFSRATSSLSRLSSHCGDTSLLLQIEPSSSDMTTPSHLRSSSSFKAADYSHRLPTNQTLNLVGSKCSLTQRGALLLPGVADSMAKECSSTTKESRYNRCSSMFIPVVVEQNEGNMALVTNEINPNDAFPNENSHHFDYDDDDNDGPGYAFGGEADDENDNKRDNAGTHTSSSLNPTTITMTVPAQMPTKKSVIFDDPWQLLDPHQPGGVHRPLRKGRTIVLPPGITELPSDCVTGSRTKSTNRKKQSSSRASVLLAQNVLYTSLHSANSFILDVYRFAVTDKKCNDNVNIPTIPLSQRLVFDSEFAYLEHRAQQVVQAQRRKARRQEQSTARNIHSDLNDNVFADANDDIVGNDYGDYEAYDYSGGNDDYDDDFVHDNGNAWTNDDNDDNYMGNNAGHLFVDEVLQSDGTESLTFEELCRVHIQKFAKGAEKYANETQLVTRVRKWQEKIQPLLEEEEHRQVFDMYLYGAAIIRRIQLALASQRRNREKKDDIVEAKIPSVPFTTITHKCSTFEIPRFFLAALSLCNSGNICIDRELNLQLIDSTMENPTEVYLATNLREM